MVTLACRRQGIQSGPGLAKWWAPRSVGGRRASAARHAAKYCAHPPVQDVQRLPRKHHERHAFGAVLLLIVPDKSITYIQSLCSRLGLQTQAIAPPKLGQHVPAACAVRTQLRHTTGIVLLDPGKLIIHSLNFTPQRVLLDQRGHEESGESFQGAIERRWLAVEEECRAFLQQGVIERYSLRSSSLRDISSCEKVILHEKYRFLFFSSKCSWIHPVSHKSKQNTLMFTFFVRSTHIFGTGVGSTAMGCKEGIKLVLIRERLASHEEHVFQIVAETLSNCCMHDMHE